MDIIQIPEAGARRVCQCRQLSASVEPRTNGQDDGEEQAAIRRRQTQIVDGYLPARHKLLPAAMVTSTARIRPLTSGCTTSRRSSIGAQYGTASRPTGT